MKWRAVAVSLGSILAVLAGSHLLGESPVDFERDVQPILQEKCLSCHTPDAAQSGLVMESVEAMLEGGEKAGPSILAGDSAGSPPGPPPAGRARTPDAGGRRPAAGSPDRLDRRMDRPDGSCGSPGRGRPNRRPKRFPP